MAEDKNKNKKRISVSESEKLLLWEEKEIGKAYEQKPKKDVKPFLIFLVMALVLGGMIFYFSTMNQDEDIAKGKDMEVSREAGETDGGEDSKTPDSSEGLVLDADSQSEGSESDEDIDAGAEGVKTDGEEAGDAEAVEKGDDMKAEDIKADGKSEEMDEKQEDPSGQQEQELSTGTAEQPQAELSTDAAEEKAVEEAKEEEVKKPQAVVYRSYKVKPKDTFFNIAMTIYNNKAYVERIKSWNKTTTLKAGTTIKLRPYKNRSMANYAPRYYKIKSGETLFSVSMKFYNEKRMIEAIKLINNIDDITAIRTGTTIQLP